MALQRKKAAYGAMQRTQAKQQAELAAMAQQQTEAWKQAAVVQYMMAHKQEEAASNETLLMMQMDPKSFLAATKRTKGDNARFGKFMALQRKKAAYGAMQRTMMKQAEARKQAAMKKS